MEDRWTEPKDAMQTTLPTTAEPAPARRRAGRWTRPDLAAARCGARTRAGRPCRAPAVHGKHRCRMHGGAPGAGAPRGNRNAVKHGFWSAAERSERRQAAALVGEAVRVLGEVGAGAGLNLAADAGFPANRRPVLSETYKAPPSGQLRQ